MTPSAIDDQPTVQDSIPTEQHQHDRPEATTPATAVDSPIAKASHPTINAEPHSLEHQITSSNARDLLAPEGVAPHDETDEIIRQVEFYFSDQNLPGDAHLLSRTGVFGDGWVSLNEILGFRKMRRFKPASRVKVSLHQSTELEIWKNKLIRRREPLKVPLTVTPKPDHNRDRNTTLIEKPWVTKGMLKPTGFEEYAADGPIRPEEYEEEQKLFDPEEAFVIRIENAITRYTSRRKMHSSTSNIFTKFLMFGGFNAGQRQFVGGLTPKDFEDFDKDQVADMQAQFAVSEAVLDGLGPDLDGASWVVDFEGMAKAFLSSSFMASFNWKAEKTVHEATNILRNFYNYLLLHDVCPEYEDQILAARDVCDLAKEEFAKLAMVDNDFPGSFNTACSMLCQGAQAAIRPIDPHADWVNKGDNVALSDKDAWVVLITGISAHCTEDQLAAVAVAAGENVLLSTVSEEHIGLEVTYVEYVTDQAKQVYGDDRITNTFIKPTGKLHCKLWAVPHASSKDLPPAVMKTLEAKRNTKYEFLIEERTLRYCFPGLKFEAVVKELQTGMKWIDAFTYVYPSFFTWTLNERVRDWREPGPPKAWQERQNAISAQRDDETTPAGEEADCSSEESPEDGSR